MSKINLICLTYAGGSIGSLYTYISPLAQDYNMVLIEYPGRGKRFKEELIDNIDDLLEDIYKQIKPVIASGEKYALLGYSMGSLLSYELYYKIKDDNLRLPEHMFFCSGRTPDGYDDFQEAKLDDESIIKGIDVLGNISKQILSRPKIRDKFVPVIRSDYKVIKSYKYQERAEKLQCNISAVSGKQDHLTMNIYHGWDKFTDGTCDFVLFDGGHFFGKVFRKELSEYIKETLSKY